MVDRFFSNVMSIMVGAFGDVMYLIGRRFDKIGDWAWDMAVKYESGA